MKTTTEYLNNIVKNLHLDSYKNKNTIIDTTNGIIITYNIEVNVDFPFQAVVQVRTLKNNSYISSWGAESNDCNIEIVKFFTKFISMLEDEESNLVIEEVKKANRLILGRND